MSPAAERASAGGKKSKKKQSSQNKVEKAAMVVPTTIAAGDEDFPRGALKTAPKVATSDAVVPDASDAALFKDEVAQPDPATYAVGAKRRVVDADDITVKKHKASLPHTLKFRNLCTGMSVLCAVKEVHDLELVMCLPNNLVGTVAITEISDEISQIVQRIANSDADAANVPSIPDLRTIFTVGQIVCCVIVELQAAEAADGADAAVKKRIELSMKPRLLYSDLKVANVAAKMTLQASVRSEEDRGYSLNCGIAGVNVFLNRKNMDENVEYNVGQIVQCSILNVGADGRAVTVSTESKILARTAMVDSDAVTLDSLKAGALVTVNVVDVTAAGLWVKFLGLFEGSVGCFHALDGSLNAVNSTDMNQLYTVGQKLRARILFSYPSDDAGVHVSVRHRIGLSLKPNILAWTPYKFAESLHIGAVVEKAAIERIDAGLGLLLTFKADTTESKSVTPAYAHISRIADTHLASIDAKKYRVKSTHRCRVVGHDLLDGVAQVSLQPSILSAKFMRHEDLKPGMVVKKATIVKLDPITDRLVISLCEVTGIRAHCPKTHLSDVPVVSHPEKRFRSGESITVRVLSVDSVNKRILVTHKRTLVNSTLPVVDSLETAEKLLVEKGSGSVWGHGVIVAVKPYGCIVTLFGDVKGLIHKSHLTESQLENITANFTAGQLVKCRVVAVERKEQRLKLSLLEPSLRDKVGGVYASAMNSFSAGQHVDGIVSAKSANEITLDVHLDGFSVIGVIAIGHLSDDTSVAHQLHSALKVGDKIADLVILRREKRAIAEDNTSVPVFTMSRKYSVRRSSDVKTLTVGEGFAGYIQHIDPKLGLFVRLPNNITALVLRGDLSDGYIADITNHFAPGDTIFGVVKEVNTEEKRYAMSIKMSDAIASSQYQSYRDLLNIGYFDDLDFLNDLHCKASSIKIGMQVTATVKQIIRGVGILTTVTETNCVREGLFTETMWPKSAIKDIDSIVSGVVIDKDSASGVLDLASNLKFASATAPKIGSVITATVILAKPTYAVVQTGEKVFGFVRSTGNMPGSKIKCRIISPQTESGRVIMALESEPSTANAVPSARSLNDIEIGSKVSGIIKSIKSSQMNIQIIKPDPTAVPPRQGVTGRVHITELIDDIATVPEFDGKSTTIFEALGYRQGTAVDGRVIGFHGAKTHNWLPITQLAGRKAVVELSTRSSIVDAETIDAYCPSFQLGQFVAGFVSDVYEQTSKYPLIVHLSPNARARIPLLEISNDCTASVDEQFYLGKPVHCVIAKIPASDSDTYVASIRAAAVDNHSVIRTLSDVQVGQRLIGRVLDISPVRGVFVQFADLERSLAGWISLVDVQDRFDSNMLDRFSKHQLVKCTVVSVNASKNEVNLSTRDSDLRPNDDTCVVSDPVVRAFSDIAEGQVLSGFIKNISDNGLYITVGRNHLVGRAKICDLSDEFVKEWQKAFSVGQLVRAKVVKKDAASSKLELSLKLSDVDPAAYSAKHGPAQDLRGIESLAVGEVLAGTIARVEKYGMFISLDGTGRRNRQLRGLCHKSEVSNDSDDDDASEMEKYAEGDRVKVIILAVDIEKGRISLGIKPSYFKTVAETTDDCSDDVSMDTDKISSIDNLVAEPEPSKLPQLDATTPMEIAVGKDTLELNADGGFEWEPSLIPPVFAQHSDNEDTADDDMSENESDDESALKQGTKKRSKRAKARSKREEEARIVEREKLAVSDSQVIVETAEDFNRLVVASPNSSYIWIKYMAFFVEMVEIDKARQVAERALKTINFREEKERFNIWIAMLNLENRFGSLESLKAIFDRAVAYSVAKHVYLALANIYQATDKYQLAEDLFAIIKKKFKSSSKAWVQYGQFYYSNERSADARKVLEQSLIVLPKHKYIKTIIKFAQFEFKYADAERGRTVIEGILSNYPKRTDLWSLFIDMEIKYENFDAARRLFERMITLKLSSKKMKFVFKKYLDFEKKYGDDDKIGHVMSCARSYVASITGEPISSDGNVSDTPEH